MKKSKINSTTTEKISYLMIAPTITAIIKNKRMNILGQFKEMVDLEEVP
jgi:hypothetical protein